MSGDQRFFDPIMLAESKAAVGHAPRRRAIHHQVALLAAELDGPPMFARIGAMRAINRHVERVFDPSRKDKRWGTAEAGARSMTSPT
jgi:hypothetical protein